MCCAYRLLSNDPLTNDLLVCFTALFAYLWQYNDTEGLRGSGHQNGSLDSNTQQLLPRIA